MSFTRCKICEKEFYAKPSSLKKGWAKYCSKKCQFEGQKTGKTLECFICQREIYRSQQELKKSNSGKYFCSKSCQTIWRNTQVFIGSKHSQWQGGRSEYKNILLKSGADQLCRRCKIKDKRVLAVHHLDRNKSNNSLSNLVWLCHNCHFLLHHNKQEEEALVVAMV